MNDERKQFESLSLKSKIREIKETIHDAVSTHTTLRRFEFKPTYRRTASDFDWPISTDGIMGYFKEFLADDEVFQYRLHIFIFDDIKEDKLSDLYLPDNDELKEFYVQTVVITLSYFDFFNLEMYHKGHDETDKANKRFIKRGRGDSRPDLYLLRGFEVGIGDSESAFLDGITSMSELTNSILKLINLGIENASLIHKDLCEFYSNKKSSNEGL